MPSGKEELAEAAAAGRAGDYPRAIGLLTKLISASDAPPEAWLLLGRAFHAAGDYSRALAAFNDYLALRPLSAQGRFFAGRACLALGLPLKAAPLFKAALEHSPGSPLILSFLGLAYLKSRRSALAVETLREAVETAAARGAPEREQKRIYRAYLNSLLLRGISLCRRGDYDLGGRMLDFARENGAGGTLLRLELGRACRETGRLEEALGHYEAALATAPGDRRILWYRASLLMALGRDGEARREIEALRSGDGAVPDLPWNSELADFFMARSFLASGQWRRAADSCAVLLRRGGPGAAMTHALYAEALRNLGEYEAARNHLERAREAEPGKKEFWYAGLLLAWEQRDWRALGRNLRGVKALPGIDENLIGRFSALLEAHETRDAKKRLALLREAVRSLGPEPELMLALAETYLALGQSRLAANWFRNTRTLKEDSEAAWRGEITAREAAAAEAGAGAEEARELRALYAACLDKWPDNHAVRRGRALFLVKAGDFAGAAPELERLLAREPGNPGLRRVLAYAYRKTGRYREAAVFLKALLREQPGSVPLLLEFAGCLERAGAGDYARAVLEKAVKSLPPSSVLSLALGRLWYKAGDTEKAFDHLREASALDPADPRPCDWMAALSRRNGEQDRAAYYERKSRERRGMVDGGK
ncbi:MAG: tetratricopeptide repeat protein [Treponematales bacterium]